MRAVFYYIAKESKCPEALRPSNAIPALHVLVYNSPTCCHYYQHSTNYTLYDNSLKRLQSDTHNGLPLLIVAGMQQSMCHHVLFFKVSDWRYWVE